SACARAVRESPVAAPEVLVRTGRAGHADASRRARELVRPRHRTQALRLVPGAPDASNASLLPLVEAPELRARRSRRTRLRALPEVPRGHRLPRGALAGRGPVFAAPLVASRHDARDEHRRELLVGPRPSGRLLDRSRSVQAPAQALFLIQSGAHYAESR